MLRLLHQVNLPYLRASWGRTALVVGGIASGVSLIVAINVLNISVLENVRRSLELMAGPADLQVTLGLGETSRKRRPTSSRATPASRSRSRSSVARLRSWTMPDVVAGTFGIGVGDALRVVTPSGVTTLTVRGLLRAEGMAAAFGNRIAVMDIAAAQQLIAQNRRIDQIDVILGTMLGVALGFVTAWIWVAINFRYLVGYYLDFHFAWSAAA